MATHASIVRSLAHLQAGGPCKVPRTMLSSCSSFVSRLSEAAVLSGHRGCVNSIHWNHDGSLLLTGSDDCTVAIWSGNNYKLIKSIRTGHVRNIFAARFVPFTNDTQIVSTGMDGQVRWIDISSSVTTAQLDAHEYMVYKIAFLPHQPHVFVTTQQDKTVRLYDLRARGPPTMLLDMRTTELGEYGVNTLAFDPLGSDRFVLGCSDPYLRIFDMRHLSTHTAAFCPSELYQRLGQDRAFMRGYYITGVDWSAKGELAATYSRDRVYTFDASRVPDAEGGRIGAVCTTPSQKFLGSRNVRTFLKEVAFLGGDQYVASGSDCGHLYIWSRATGELVQCIRADAHVVNGVAPHPSLLKIATCGIDSEGKVYDIGPVVTWTDEKAKAAKERSSGADGTASESDSEGGETITLNQLLRLLQRNQGARGELRAGNLAQLMRMLSGQENEEDDEEEEEEAEEEEAAEEAPGEADAAPRMSMEQIAAELDQVEKEKDQGNEQFRSEQWRPARESYTAALNRLNNIPMPPPTARLLRNRLQGLRLTVLMNRAAALVKDDAAEEAIADCNAALALDPHNVKAIFRRGCAYLLAGRFEEAEADANEALRIAPSSADIRRLLLAARGRRAGQL